MSGIESIPASSQEPAKQSDAVLSARRAAARALIEVRKSLGEDTSEEIRQFAAGEADEYIGPLKDRSDEVEQAQRSAARALIGVRDSLGKPISDEVRSIAGLDESR